MAKLLHRYLKKLQKNISDKTRFEKINDNIITKSINKCKLAP